MVFRREVVVGNISVVRADMGVDLFIVVVGVVVVVVVVGVVVVV